ncbi:MAG: tRNA pseudouridine(13) synthase TruD [Nanoarchaeota archaeon]|nr:tRNA pseudouridine(13) synthase TruD [Nanoarchaeota archaeon]
MKLKEKPEDFVVKEVLNLDLSGGEYHYYKMTKTNWNTLDVIKQINKQGLKYVGYAGLKDRNAVTTQYISVKKKINFLIKDVEFEYLGSGKQGIYIGMLEGNEFIITIRDLDKKLRPVEEMLNIFGEQRFSTKNVLIGKYLIKSNFYTACKELGLKYEGNDYIGALRKFGVNNLRLYVHAYQSFLWNKVAKKSKKEVLPILGYLTESKDYDLIMKKEEITQKDFMIRSLPEIGSEGGERKRVIDVKDFQVLDYSDDELNPGKKKQVVNFFLEKGAYATVVIDNLQ